LAVHDADPVRDGAACAAIYAPYITDSAISFEEEVPSVEEFTQRMRTTTKTHPWLVFEDEGDVVGYAYGTVHRTRSAYRFTTEVTVYVAQSHHRAGIGRRLYEALFDRLRAQNFNLAVAGITLPNDASVGLHEALGFVPIGVYPRIGWKFGQWWDVGWWSLDLRDPPDAAPDELLPPGSG
jgi:L-amino acid N-acyltransferase YncA